jgi:uncharacterized protein
MGDRAMRNIWLILFLVASGAAHAASFDCAKAKTAQEKAICGSAELSLADERMAEAYRAVLAAAPPETKEEVIEGQRQWLRSIAITCAARDWAPAGRLQSCLTEVYRKRTDLLRNAIIQLDGVLFVWKSIILTAPDDPDTAENDRLRGVLSDHGILYASWPRAIASTPEWQAWNVALEKTVRGMASQDEPQHAETWKQELAIDMDTDLTVEIGLVNRELVAAMISNHWYGHGAAHPNLYFTQFNWMLKEQRLMRPEDLFLRNSGWDRAILERCERAVGAELTQGLEPVNAKDTLANLHKALLEIIVNPKNWQLENTGLTIPFQPYAVACYACTPSPVTISWEDLKPFLQPGFVIPK